MLAFTRSEVENWLKEYGTQFSGVGKHNTFESPYSLKETRYDELNHNIIESNPKSRCWCK